MPRPVSQKFDIPKGVKSLEFSRNLAGQKMVIPVFCYFLSTNWPGVLPS